MYRRTYGALNGQHGSAPDAERPPGQVLVNQNVRKATAEEFTWEELPPLLVKGSHRQ
jgi:hypothetical protein